MSGKPAPRSWPFLQRGSAQGVLGDAQTRASQHCSSQQRAVSSGGEGAVGALPACTAQSLQHLLPAEEGAAPRTQPGQRPRGLGHGSVSMGPELQPLLREGGGEMRLPRSRSTETLQHASSPAEGRGAEGCQGVGRKEQCGAVPSRRQRPSRKQI